MKRQSLDRPIIFNYAQINGYLRDMHHWLKHSVNGYSIRKETRHHYRCSPALVSQVMKGTRVLTPDRVPAFGKIFRLNPEEKSFLQDWVRRNTGQAPEVPRPVSKARRKRGQNSLLHDWLNVYVKDSCRVRGFKPDPNVIQRILGGLANPRRIERSLEFLLREGFWRKTLKGEIIENDVLVTTTNGDQNRKIQRFHRKALDVAKRGIHLFPVDKRHSSALILPLNPESLKELKEILREFYEKLLVFAENHPSDDHRLYQVLIHLSPIGGAQDDA